MKALILITAVLLLSSISMASDDQWFCSSESSQRSGATVQVCGVGEEKLEADAREAATKAAKYEFRSICEEDTSCNNHAVEIRPMRQTCSKSSEGFKCYRMLEYTISEDLAKTAVAKAVSKVSPKIFKGMSKEDLVKAFGTPDVYIEASDRFLIVNYVNKDFCSSRCTIGLDNDKVYKFDGFKIENTTLMETKSIWSKLGVN